MKISAVFIVREHGAAHTHAAIGASEILGSVDGDGAFAYTAFACQEVRDRICAIEYLESRVYAS
jgi:hypothetical protein